MVSIVNAIFSSLKCHHTGKYICKKKKKKYSFISKIYINYGHLVYQSKLL